MSNLPTSVFRVTESHLAAKLDMSKLVASFTIFILCNPDSVINFQFRYFAT